MEKGAEEERERRDTLDTECSSIKCLLRGPQKERPNCRDNLYFKEWGS